MEKNKRPSLPITADQAVLATGSAVSAGVINALAHSNGSVGLMLGGLGVAASFMLVPKELRLRHLKAAIPSFYAGDDTQDDEEVSSPRHSTMMDRGQDDELAPPRSKKVSAKFTFSQVLKDFTPSLDRIYLGELQDGTVVYSTAKDLCHMAIAGSTGGGKSSIIRMVASQLCAAGASVLLLNPHYTRYDLESQEDWTPFEPYLVYDPMECRNYDTIEYYLKQVATELLPKRLEKYARSQPLGKPYFLVMDELPAIMKKVPDAAEYLSDILREGRKVGIFLITASQDFLVKTIAPEGGGGAIRDCYRTAMYTGGDATTARVLLDMSANQINEDQLGKGTIMLRHLSVKKAQQARVPYVDNESLYRLLGPSDYNTDDIYADKDELHNPDDAESYVSLFQQMTGQQVEPDTEDPMPVLPTRVPATPILPEKVRLADDLPLAAVIALWNANGGEMSINELAEVWGLKRNQAEKLRKKILAEAERSQQSESED